MSETYLPSARDSVIAYFGRNASGNLRCYCVRCHDTTPLTNASRVYGDLSYPEPRSLLVGSWGSEDTCESCDGCRVSLLSLSRQCQSEHDAQQAEWSRGAVTHLVEYGVPGTVRCRIY